jgi:hypothetical protein
MKDLGTSSSETVCQSARTPNALTPSLRQIPGKGEATTLKALTGAREIVWIIGFCYSNG